MQGIYKFWEEQLIIISSIIQQKIDYKMSFIPSMQNRQQQFHNYQSDIVDKSKSHQENDLRQQQARTKMIAIQQQLRAIFNTILKTKDMAELSTLIKEYCVAIVASNSEDIFTDYFIEYKFLEVLFRRLNESKDSSELLKSVFILFEFLLQALKRDEDLIYFLFQINKLGFISQTYHFKEQEDIPYYANFLKRMINKINEDKKFIMVFFNQREPHFPLVTKLLSFYNCPDRDRLMHTTSKQSIMQISNNDNILVRSYINNFPFIIFYPLYLGEILKSFRKTINQEKNEIDLQNLVNHLQFMEQFIANKERAAVDMYTNTFLKMIGREIYCELSNTTQKNLKRVKKMERIIIQNIIPKLSVIKIKMGLLMLFNTNISSKMKKCYEAKEVKLQTEYWLIDTCQQQIVQHCKSLFFKNQLLSKSFFKTINSYIPRSKDNWLYYQMAKISELIGFQLELNKPINEQQYLPHSFLDALWTMIDDSFSHNDIFANLTKIKDEQLLFNHLNIINELYHCQKNEITVNIESIVNQMCICTSQCLIQVFFKFVVNSKVQAEQSKFIEYSYIKMTEKLIYFIMTKGMEQFILRVHQIKAFSGQEFVMDIYREIQCDILLFVALRTLLGQPNQNGNKFETQSWDDRSNITAQMTFKCRQSSESRSQLWLILDGQYLKIKNKHEHLIHTEQMLLANLQFYEEKDMVVIAYNSIKVNFSITVLIELQLKSHFLKEVSIRRNLSNSIELQIKNMLFQLDY